MTSVLMAPGDVVEAEAGFLFSLIIKLMELLPDITDSTNKEKRLPLTRLHPFLHGLEGFFTELNSIITLN